jgi:NAD(P)H dehydrogenase (quinone)
MRISIILGHPRGDSFSHAVAATAADTARSARHEIAFHDLQAEGFDPVLPAGEEPASAQVPALVELHCREIAHADGIVIVHPNWWGMPPAILTGWADRVLRPSVAYRFEAGDAGEGTPIGLLCARSALVFNTSNTFADREARVFGDPLERIWKDCIFGLCGVARVERRTFGPIVTSSKTQRNAWLDQTRALVAEHFPSERVGTPI